MAAQTAFVMAAAKAAYYFRIRICTQSRYPTSEPASVIGQSYILACQLETSRTPELKTTIQ